MAQKDKLSVGLIIQDVFAFLLPLVFFAVFLMEECNWTHTARNIIIFIFCSVLSIGYYWPSEEE